MPWGQLALFHAEIIPQRQTNEEQQGQVHDALAHGSDLNGPGDVDWTPFAGPKKDIHRPTDDGNCSVGIDKGLCDQGIVDCGDYPCLFAAIRFSKAFVVQLSIPQEREKIYIYRISYPGYY
ncbi:MAG: hypothetical protein AAF530_19460 [Pseudomonadota bacterium]